MLTTAQLVRVLLLICAAVAVYISTLHILIQSRRLKAHGEIPSRVFIRRRRFVYALALLGLLCLAYAYWLEPRWLRTTHVDLSTRSLSSGASVRIVHLSDLHSEAKPLLEPRLPALVREQHPDLIVFTGDMANNSMGIPTWENLLHELAQIAPVYAVRGNWDYHPWNSVDVYRRAGVTLLDAETATFKIRGSSINIAGVGAAETDESTRVLSTAPPDGFTIFLDHFPDEIERVGSQGRANLYLAGHTHGGQVALPFYGALVTLSRFDKKYESGLHRVGNTYLYVSRGIGMEGDPAPRVRFAAPPELVVIDVSGMKP
jgi:predicted MPP superfamily phosphohydrolase